MLKNVLEYAQYCHFLISPIKKPNVNYKFIPFNTRPIQIFKKIPQKNTTHTITRLQIKSLPQYNAIINQKTKTTTTSINQIPALL